MGAAAEDLTISSAPIFRKEAGLCSPWRGTSSLERDASGFGIVEAQEWPGAAGVLPIIDAAGRRGTPRSVASASQFVIELKVSKIWSFCAKVYSPLLSACYSGRVHDCLGIVETHCIRESSMNVDARRGLETGLQRAQFGAVFWFSYQIE